MSHFLEVGSDTKQIMVINGTRSCIVKLSCKVKHGPHPMGCSVAVDTGSHKVKCMIDTSVCFCICNRLDRPWWNHKVEFVISVYTVFGDLVLHKITPLQNDNMVCIIRKKSEIFDVMTGESEYISSVPTLFELTKATMVSDCQEHILNRYFPRLTSPYCDTFWDTQYTEVSMLKMYRWLNGDNDDMVNMWQLDVQNDGRGSYWNFPICTDHMHQPVIGPSREPNFVMHRIQHLLMYPEFRPVLEGEIHVSNIVTRYMDDLVTEHMPQNERDVGPCVVQTVNVAQDVRQILNSDDSDE